MFSDISLNAPKESDSKNCNVRALFQFSDINAAKAAFKEYVSKHGLVDVEGILKAIEVMHGDAIEFDDQREHHRVVRPKEFDRFSGSFGEYFSFCRIPDDVWNSIKDEILKECLN